MIPITKSQRLEIQELAAKATQDHENDVVVATSCRTAYPLFTRESRLAEAIPAYEAALVRVERERDEALGEISRMTMRPAAEIIESERHRAGLLDRMQAERDALAAKLAEAETEVERSKLVWIKLGAVKDLAAMLAASKAKNHELEDRLRVCQEQNDALGDANELAVKLAAVSAALEEACDIADECKPDYPKPHDKTGDRIDELRNVGKESK